MTILLQTVIKLSKLCHLSMWCPSDWAWAAQRPASTGRNANTEVLGCADLPDPGCTGLSLKPDCHQLQDLLGLLTNDHHSWVCWSLTSPHRRSGQRGSWDPPLGIQPPFPSSCVQFCPNCMWSWGEAREYRWGRVRGGTSSTYPWGCHHPCWVQTFQCGCFRSPMLLPIWICMIGL